MRLVLFVAADYASVEPQTGKLNILGVFTRISANKFPVIHPRMAIVARIQAELTDHHDERKLRIEMRDEDENRLVFFSGPFKFRETGTGVPGEHNAIIEYNGLRFPRPGYYKFTISVDDEHLGDTLVELVRIQSPQP